MGDEFYSISPWQRYIRRIIFGLLLLAIISYFFSEAPRKSSHEDSSPTLYNDSCPEFGDNMDYHLRLSPPPGWRYLDRDVTHIGAVDVAPPLQGASLYVWPIVYGHAPRYQGENSRHPSQVLRDKYFEDHDPHDRERTEMTKLAPRKIGGVTAFGVSYTADIHDLPREAQSWFIASCGESAEIELRGAPNSPFPAELTDILDSAQWVFFDRYAHASDALPTLLEDSLSIPDNWTYLSVGEIEAGFGERPNFAIIPSEYAPDWERANRVGIEAQYFLVEHYARMLGVSLKDPLNMSHHARDHAFNTLQNSDAHSDLRLLADHESHEAPTLFGFSYTWLRPEGKRLSCETWFATSAVVYEFNVCVPAERPEELEMLRTILTSARWGKEITPPRKDAENSTADSAQSDTSAEEVATP